MSHPIFSTKLLNFNLIIEKSQIRSDQKAIDIGCGQSGYFTFLLSKAVGTKGLVYAVDILRNNLDLINNEANHHKITNIRTIWSDIELLNATKIPTSSVDCAYIVNTLHQTQKPINSLKESIRLVKPGGKVILVEWLGLASPLGPEVSRRIDKSKLVDAAKKNGLYLDSEFQAGRYHFGLVLIKV